MANREFPEFEEVCLKVDDYLFMTDLLIKDDERRKNFKDNFLKAWNSRIKNIEYKIKKEKENER